MNERFNKQNKKTGKKPTPQKPKEIIAPPVRNEIPLYDPQTGEPNHLYEELTGKKNPLTELRKNPDPISGLYNSVASIEPKRKNRWLVHFPEHFKIESWCVSKTQRPSVKIIDAKFLGIKYGVKTEWEKITFEFIDPIGPSTSARLYEIMGKMLDKTFDYKLELLDPTGFVVETWDIKKCRIEAISLGSLDYADKDIAKCFMLIKPGEVTLRNN